MEFFSEYNVSVIRKTKGKLPSLPFVALAHAILGKKYELSIAFIGDNESQELNNTYRGKDYPTNILSFPLDEISGEICINLKKARRDAKEFEKTYEEFLLHLLVHGMLHLKGLDHGEEMDSLEEKFIRKFTK